MSSSTAINPISKNDVELALRQMKAELDKLDPLANTTEDSGWQERKSTSTRITLLKATVECLAEFGYAKTTTQLVAASAKISRGAMLHHYSSKSELISATIDFIIFQRMLKFYSEIAQLTKKQRVEQGQGVEIVWKSMQSPEYEAYLELSIASRTDKDLKKVFNKRARALDNYCFDQTSVFFPEWDNKTEDKLRLAQDLIMCALEGLYIRKSVMSTRQRRVAVRSYISEMVQMLRD